MADDQKKPYQEESIGTKLVIVIGAIVGIGAVIFGLYLSDRIGLNILLLSLLCFCKG